MRYDYNNDYRNKFVGETFDVTHSFLSVLNGSSLAASLCTASSFDIDGNNVSASMISNIRVSSPNVTFLLSGGSSNQTYRLKVIGKTNSGKVYEYFINCEVFGDYILNTKLGYDTANSYITIEEANDYIRTKYGHNSLWDSLDINGKKRVLAQAALDIDRFNYIDNKYYDSQALKFPRDTHDTVTGNCATETLTSFRNSALKSDTYGVYPTDYWKYGTVHITDGTPLYDVRNIAMSNVTTGSITVDTAFTATPTDNTTFLVFAPLDKNIRYAQCEQALYIIESGGKSTIENYRNAGAKEIEIGDVRVQFSDSSTPNKIKLSPASKKLISKYLKRTLTYGRA